MRVMNIPPFPRKIEILDLENFLRTRLSTKVVMWPNQALPLLCYMCFPNDEAARDDLLSTLWSWEDASEPPATLDKLRRIQADWLRVADVFHLYCDLIEGQHQQRRGGPSIGKAITLVSAKAKDWGTGKSKLWELWTAYKCRASRDCGITCPSGSAQQIFCWSAGIVGTESDAIRSVPDGHADARPRLGGGDGVRTLRPWVRCVPRASV